MNVNIIDRLNKINNEIKRRKNNNKLQYYNTQPGKIHKKQLLFHQDPHKNRWVFGGNRSGKTECGAVEVVYMARGCHPYRDNKPNTIGWVVSLSTQVQRDVAQQKILHYLNPDWIYDIVMLSGKKDNPKGGVIDYIQIKNTFGGISTIGFKSCDQGREKFQGASLDYVWFDEEPPEDIYQECRMRVLDKCGDIFGTMTPLKGLTWVYDQIYLNANNDPQIWSEHINWHDNPFLDPEQIKLLERSMSYDQLESRKYGKFVGGGGLVYSEFDPQVHVIEPFDVPTEWYDTISIDPGLHNPLACHWYAVDYDGNVYVIAEHFDKDKDIIYHANCIKDICRKLNWQVNSSGNYQALIDSAATQRTLASTRSVVDLFYDNGISANPKVNKDLFSGISRVKSYLKDATGRAKLFIFASCTNLIREIKSYYWSANDVPYKRDDHCLDELRYYIMSKPQPTKQPCHKSAIQLDKEKLFRNLKNHNSSLRYHR